MKRGLKPYVAYYTLNNGNNGKFIFYSRHMANSEDNLYDACNYLYERGIYCVKKINKTKLF